MVEFSNPAAYELWMGRWSARLAPAFVGFACLPKAGRCLDVGSRTGALAAALLDGVEDGTVIGIEPAETYVAYSRQRLRDERLEFRQGDALAIPFEDDSFDGALALLILQELPDVPKALGEMRRVTRPGGCVAASQWDFEQGMPMLALFWETVIETIATDAAREAAETCMPVGYSNARALTRLWNEAGLVDVEAKGLEIAMTFEGFEDYWGPFLSGVTPTSSYAAKLSGEQRDALKRCLRRKLIGEEPDRPFALPAQAWAVRGTVPQP